MTEGLWNQGPRLFSCTIMLLAHGGGLAVRALGADDKVTSESSALLLAKCVPSGQGASVGLGFFIYSGEVIMEPLTELRDGGSWNTPAPPSPRSSLTTVCRCGSAPAPCRRLSLIPSPWHSVADPPEARERGDRRDGRR